MNSLSEVRGALVHCKQENLDSDTRERGVITTDARGDVSSVIYCVHNVICHKEKVESEIQEVVTRATSTNMRKEDEDREGRRVVGVVCENVEAVAVLERITDFLRPHYTSEADVVVHARRVPGRKLKVRGRGEDSMKGRPVERIDHFKNLFLPIVVRERDRSQKVYLY